MTNVVVTSSTTQATSPDLLLPPGAPPADAGPTGLAPAAEQAAVLNTALTGVPSNPGTYEISNVPVSLAGQSGELLLRAAAQECVAFYSRQIPQGADIAFRAMALVSCGIAFDEHVLAPLLGVGPDKVVRLLKTASEKWPERFRPLALEAVRGIMGHLQAPGQHPSTVNVVIGSKALVAWINMQLATHHQAAQRLVPIKGSSSYPIMPATRTILDGWQ